METNNKLYGFTITMYEYHATIPTLWDTTMSTSLQYTDRTTVTELLSEFTRENPDFVHPNNAMGYISDNGGESYNLCHCTFSFFRASTSN